MKRATLHGKSTIIEATATRDERVEHILNTGLEAKRITKSDIETFHKLQSSFEAYNDPGTYKAMQEILRKAQGQKA